MENQIQINSISGTSPFDIYVCDETMSYCFFVSGITTTTHTFNVPPPLESISPIILKIIDANDCEKISLLSCY